MNMNESNSPWGAIFDWDGVIIDSSSYHEESWERLAEEKGLPLPEGHFKKGFGMKNVEVIPQILSWTEHPDKIEELSQAKEAHYRTLVKERGIEPLPGVRHWLEMLRENEIPCIVASSAERENIDAALNHVGLHEFFSEITSGNEVKEGKPAPDIFLLAAKRLGIDPNRCVVFEDAHVGTAAARAAGCKVVAVTTTHSRNTFEDVDHVVNRLDELSVSELSSWFPAI